ncbi:MAG: hypothetical protein ABIR16_06305 [Dokdonella sp.]
MDIAIQFVGALAILVPFALLQMRRTTTQSWLYLWLNLIGAAILGWSAWVGAQWGFVILEAVWGLASLVGIIRRVVDRK